MGEIRPKESGSNDRLTANAEYRGFAFSHRRRCASGDSEDHAAEADSRSVGSAEEWLGGAGRGSPVEDDLLLGVCRPPLPSRSVLSRARAVVWSFAPPRLSSRCCVGFRPRRPMRQARTVEAARWIAHSPAPPDQ